MKGVIFIFDGISELIFNIISEIVKSVQMLFFFIFEELFGTGNDFLSRPFDLSLFSENIIFTTNIKEIIVFITITIFLVVIIKFLVKASYNLVKKVFGVFKL